MQRPGLEGQGEKGTGEPGGWPPGLLPGAGGSLGPRADARAERAAPVGQLQRGERWKGRLWVKRSPCRAQCLGKEKDDQLLAFRMCLPGASILSCKTYAIPVGMRHLDAPLN